MILTLSKRKMKDFPFRSFRHLPVHWMPETAIPEVIPAVLHYIRWKLQDDTVIRKKTQIEIYMMALLHDIGKIGIPDKVLRKKSQLTDKEYDLIKTHPVVGYEILNNITDMPRLGIGARWHHERYDGNGYPDGLIGTDIPEEARIISVADAYDAMSSSRCCNDNFTQEYIIKELAAGKESQFDPVFTDIMLSIVNDGKTYSNQ